MMGYPDGPVVEAASQRGDPRPIAFQRGLTEQHDVERHRFDFSFSGLKSPIERWVKIRELNG